MIVCLALCSTYGCSQAYVLVIRKNLEEHATECNALPDIWAPRMLFFSVFGHAGRALTVRLLSPSPAGPYAPNMALLLC